MAQGCHVQVGGGGSCLFTQDGHLRWTNKAPPALHKVATFTVLVCHKSSLGLFSQRRAATLASVQYRPGTNPSSPAHTRRVATFGRKGQQVATLTWYTSVNADRCFSFFLSPQLETVKFLFLAQIEDILLPIFCPLPSPFRKSGMS